MSEPVTREEQLLSAIATGGDILYPITRKEMYLAYLAGDTSISLPEPVTRKEQFLYQACLTGGSGGEGITPAGTKSITENGIYDVTRYASADVNVPTEEINNQDKTITANGEYTADTGYTGLGKVVVDVHTSGGGTANPSAKWNDVTFLDYDGTILYSCTLEEAQALTELPALPSHNGLVCQGWNWTLDAIKALGRAVTVGANYITDDGATRLHICIATEGRMTVPLYFGQTAENGVSIDWGDGSAAETLAGTGYVNTSHTYAQPGDYVISLLPEEGCTLSLGSGSSTYCLLGATANAGRVYTNMLQTAHIGKNVTSIGSYAFNGCYSLASITLPEGVTSIGSSAFQGCSSLASITLPEGVTSIGSSAFQSCFSLASITLPEGVTSIGGSAFQSCYSLASITLPEGVTSIGSYAFQSCFSLASITLPEGVTSIGSYAFNGCYSLASITLPEGVTSIGSSAFQGCSSLASITLPEGVTSIGSSAFYSCYGMRYYDFTACTSVPAMQNTNAFSNIPSDCQMLIPAALYDEWSAATNWATYASYMAAV